MKEIDKFKSKWKNFIKAIFSPVPLFSLIVATVLIVISINCAERKEFSILMNLIGSIFLAVAGAFVKGGYDELVGESVLIKKGQSAIRNLSSITNQITFIRAWINKFVKKDVTKRDLEEINRHLETTLVNINSGLADWIDIVPELKEGGEMAKSLESTIKAYAEEIFKKKRELLKASENKELKKQLEGKIRELEKEVKDLIYQKGEIISSSVTISSTPASFGSVNSQVKLSDNFSYFGPSIKKKKNLFNEFVSVVSPQENLP